MILVNERGRQGIIRGQQKRAEYIANLRKKKKLDQEKNKEAEAIQVIQKYLRAFSDRQEVEKLRNEEMEFLGILPQKMSIDDLKFIPESRKANFDIDKEIAEIRTKRKGEQQSNANELDKMVRKVRKEIEEHETPDMKENLLYQMRNWITDYYEQHEGKELPDKIENFYTRDEKAVPLSKEEADAQRKALAEKEKAEKKAKEDKKKGKMTEAEAFMEARAARGPDNSRALRNLNEEVQKYVDEWLSKEQNDEFEQRPSKDLIIRQVMPEIENNVQHSLILDQNCGQRNDKSGTLESVP